MTEQQERALSRATEVRTRRAGLKREMKRGEQDARGLLLDPPPWLEGMRIDTFLRACPKVGPVKTKRIISTAKVRPTDRVGNIPLNRRCFLCTQLP